MTSVVTAVSTKSWRVGARAEPVVARWDGHGRWIERMDYGFFKKEIHVFEMVSIELLFTLVVHNAFPSWARGGGCAWLAVTSRTLGLWFNGGCLIFQKLSKLWRFPERALCLLANNPACPLVPKPWGIMDSCISYSLVFQRPNKRPLLGIDDIILGFPCLNSNNVHFRVRCDFKKQFYKHM